MIRDLLTSTLKEAFPNMPFSFSASANPFVTLEAPLAEIGNLEIYDDGEEATVEITKVTHGHFNPYNPTLTQEQRERWVVEEVMSFLHDLFADRVLLGRAETGGAGGWQILAPSQKPQTVLPGWEYFFWSRPYDTRHAL